MGLVNAYLDLGTWWCITPFIGAGVGVAYNKIEHFRDTNVIAGGGGWAESGTKTNLAWALHAGASYKVTSNFAVDLSYRYLNLGKAETGTLVNLDPNARQRQSIASRHVQQSAIARRHAEHAMAAAAGAASRRPIRSCARADVTLNKAS